MIALNEVKDIEGKFGQAKRRFSLNRVMTKLANTSETAIAFTFLVINLEALLKQLAFFGFKHYQRTWRFLRPCCQKSTDVTT
jgi:IS5 family transposase